MADIEKISVGGTSYDVRDALAAHALSDIAVAGDNVTFKTPSNIDYIASSNKVNSPSIVNGLFTTTSSSYLQINNASISNYSGSIFTGNYSWAWTVKFKTPADVSEQHTIFRMGSSLTDFNAWCTLSESTSTPKVISAALHLSNNVWTNSETGSGITEVKPNTWYWVRLSRDISTNTYKFEISEDGEVWSTEISYVSTYSFYNTKSDLLLSGKYGSTLGTTEYDLTGVSFTSNYGSGINWVAYIHDERTSINATVPSITVDQTYNSASANAQSGVAINGAGFLKNSATGSNSLTILGNATGYQNSVNIGAGSKVGSSGGTAIGYNARAEYSNGVAVGYEAYASGNAVCIGYPTVTVNRRKGACNTNTIAIGQATAANSEDIAIGVATAYGSHSIAIGRASATANYAIQLGTGTNSDANTFSVGLSNSLNVRLLNSNGTIPGERMALQGTEAPTTSTVGSVGQFYVDTTNQIGYMCVSTADSTYVWKQITA